MALPSSPELLNILNSIKLNFMLPLSNGNSVQRLILIIHKSQDLKYFIHALKISWTEVTYIKVSRNSKLRQNLAFGRILRKLHPQRFSHWNTHLQSPKAQNLASWLTHNFFLKMSHCFFLPHKLFKGHTWWWPSAPQGMYVFVCHGRVKAHQQIWSCKYDLAEFFLKFSY